MDALFGLLGLLGFVIFFVIFIVSIIKKKSKKVSLIGMAVCFILFIVGVSLSTPNNSSNNISKSTNNKPENTVSSNTKLKENKTSSAPKEDINTFKSECTTIDYKELARSPQKFENAKVKYTGQVIQALESGLNVELRVNVTKDEFGNYSDDTIFVTYRKANKDENRILEDDIITLWGYSKGLITYTSALGIDVTIPRIDAVAIELNNPQ